MPSTSAKQARFMNIVAHSPEFAQKAGIPQSVGQEFHAADKREHGKRLAAMLRQATPGRSPR